MLESYVSSEAIGEHGAAVEVAIAIFPWISPRVPVSSALANGSVTVLNCCDPTAKDAGGVPIAPTALVNEIVPVQDGAVAVATLVPPEDKAVAVFTTVMEAVSPPPRPTGGNK
jgi:hypothetical protein